MAVIKEVPNVIAALDMIAWAEIGPNMLSDPLSDDGYRLLVGSLPGRLKTFDSYADHPRVMVELPNLGIRSSAAGRYQFLSRTWDAIVRNYGFRGRFIPEAQDLAAVKLLAECGALPVFKAGRVREAIAKASPIWASLPGAGYGQREHKLVRLLEIFESEKPDVQIVEEEALVACFCECGGVVA